MGWSAKTLSSATSLDASALNRASNK
jgi:hypothetical protein